MKLDAKLSEEVLKPKFLNSDVDSLLLYSASADDREIVDLFFLDQQMGPNPN
jgi:hypothetical protein